MHATKKPPFTSTLTNVLDGSSRSISPRTHSGTVHAGFVAVAVGIFSLSPPPPRTTKKCILLLPLYSVPFCRGKERGKFLLPSSSFSHIHSLSFLPAPPRFISSWCLRRRGWFRPKCSSSPCVFVPNSIHFCPRLYSSPKHPTCKILNTRFIPYHMRGGTAIAAIRKRWDVRYL